MTWTISTQITQLIAPMDSQWIDLHWDHGTTLLDDLGRVLANIEGVEVRRTVEVDEKDDFLITTDERKTVVSKCRLVKADLDVIMFMIRGWTLSLRWFVDPNLIESESFKIKNIVFDYSHSIKHNNRITQFKLQPSLKFVIPLTSLRNRLSTLQRMARMASKRLQKELAELNKSCPTGCVMLKADDLETWTIRIEVLGDTIYEDEIFALRFRFDSSYPIEVSSSLLSLIHRCAGWLVLCIWRHPKSLSS